MMLGENKNICLSMLSRFGNCNDNSISIFSIYDDILFNEAIKNPVIAVEFNTHHFKTVMFALT